MTAASPVSTPARAWIAGPERADGVDQVERGANRPFGVVLPGDRRAPDGHHRVADELLDRAAVALDDLARQVEVAGQELADLLGVALLGERREADEVGEQDGDVTALGDGLSGRRVGAGVAEAWRAVRPAAIHPGRVPHSLQNFASGRVGAPHAGQASREAGAAVLAELGAGRILAPADGTGHARPPGG